MHNDTMSDRTDRIPFGKSIKISKTIQNNVDSFKHNYNKASTVNDWSNEQKKSL